MATAEFVQNNFLGGEWSATAQGRFDLPAYRTAMNVCLNGLPLIQGAWTRRPGFLLAAQTNQGQPARVISFPFQESQPYTLEFTTSQLRAYSGYSLAMTNDAQIVSSISSASPAVVTTGTAHGWAAGDTVMFSGTTDPQLLNRQFAITLVNRQTNEFTLADAMSGAAFNGALVTSGATGVSRVQVYTTPYAGTDWENIRFVAGDGLNGSDGTGIILHGSYAPQVLSVVTDPASSQFATFAINPATFQDGPYLDFVSNGAEVTPSGVNGIIDLTVAFAAYDSTTAYSLGDFVSSSNIAYQSLIDQNVGNTPATSPGDWEVVNPLLAVGPNGFVSTDIGRHIRLSSEPALWDSGTAYAAGAAVTYGAQTYWTSLTSDNTGNIPGVDITNWQINPTGSTWSWGKITGILNFISGTVSGVVQIGDATDGGGLVAAFDGITDQTPANSALKVFAEEPGGENQVLTQTAFIGNNFSGTVATGYAISSATIYAPASSALSTCVLGGNEINGSLQVTASLYGNASAPANDTDGTLLGTVIIPATQIVSSDAGTILAGTTGASIPSNDLTTVWPYVWVVISSTFTVIGLVNNTTTTLGASQVQFFSPVSSTASSSVSVEILGPPLLYTNAIRTWQLGLFNGTVGWPTCGTYHEGRLWLGGSVNNRFDASVPNQNWQGNISFAPTNYDGTVTDDNALSYTLNAPGTNTIQWFKPDLQGIIIGCERGEWLAFATTLNAPLSPLNIDAHEVTRQGSSVVSTAVPVQTEHTTVYIQRFARKLIEYFTDIFSGKFSAPDLAESATHLTGAANPFVELAYQQNISPNIWARTQNGSLLGCAYQRNTLMSSQGPNAKGWHRHTLGSGRSITSLAIGPSPDGTLDTPVVVTAPVASSNDVYHVCFLNRIFEETDTIMNANFLDESIVNVSYSVVGNNLVIVGLWPLNGYSCDVWAGGLDCGTIAVSGGFMTVPLNATLTSAFIAAFNGAMPIAVGFTYTSQGQLLPPRMPQDAGTRLGPALAKTQRGHNLAVSLVGTQGISFGTSFTDSVGGSSTMKAAQLKTGNGEGTQLIPANALFTGTFWQPLTDSYSYGTKVCWQITRPFPATVAALGATVQTQDQ